MRSRLVPAALALSRSRLLALALFVVALLGASRAWAYVPPTMTGHVTDTTQKLSAAERGALDRKLSAYRACSTHEIAVLIAASLGGAPIEDVAYTTFNTWKIGRAGRDNGVLLVLAPNERRVRIEVGKGVAGDLPDLRANDILRQHVSPHLKRDELWQAVDEGTTEIGRALGGCAMVPVTVASVAPPVPTTAPPAPTAAPPRPAPPAPAPAVTPRPFVDLHLVARVLMALVILALVALAVIGRRGDRPTAVFVGVVGALFFSIASMLFDDGGELDGTISFFGMAVLVLMLVNVICWRLRRFEHGQFAGASGGGGGSSSSPDDPFRSFSSSSSSSPSDTSSSGGDGGGYSGGGGTSGGAGSSDSY